MKKGMICAMLLIWAALSTVAPVLADDISDQLERGVKLYKDGNINESLSELEFAIAQIRQKKAEAYKEVLPEAPAGWKAEKAETQAMGQVMLGGGISASRAYRKGDSEVKVEMVSDSPLLQTVAVLFANPMLMQSQGQKLVRLGDLKAVVQQPEDNQAELQMMVDGKVLVRVEVNQTPNAAQVAQEFATKINLAKLRQLLR